MKARSLVKLRKLLMSKSLKSKARSQPKLTKSGRKLDESIKN